MKSPSDQGTLTYREFVVFCESRSERYEYVDGRPVVVAPPSNVHADIATGLVVCLAAHLAGGPCRVRQSAALSTGTNERVPDLLVTCDEEDLRFGTRVNRAPKLVIEILSPNPGDDLDRKVDEYASVASIEDYLIVSSTRRSVVHYRRGRDGRFTFEPIVIAGTLRLESIGYDLDIDRLYRDANMP